MVVSLAARASQLMSRRKIDLIIMIFFECRQKSLKMEDVVELLSRPLADADRGHMKEGLKAILKTIELVDTDYDKREILVGLAIVIAKILGYKAGVRFDSSSEEGRKWPVWCIELPGAGEVSWHSPVYERTYDGYTTEEKYRRCREFIAEQ